MSSSTDHDPDNRPPKREDWVQLMVSMADTTWRMFTPPAIFVPAGIYADLKWHTKPWLTVLSVPISLGISVLLIKKQLEKDS